MPGGSKVTERPPAVPRGFGLAGLRKRLKYLAMKGGVRLQDVVGTENCLVNFS